MGVNYLRGSQNNFFKMGKSKKNHYYIILVSNIEHIATDRVDLNKNITRIPLHRCN